MEENDLYDLYDFELERVIEKIKKDNVQRVGIQLPEGLKKYAIDIANKIESSTQSQVIIFTDPIYGACDTKEDEAELLNLDLVFHFGHQ